MFPWVPSAVSSTSSPVASSRPSPMWPSPVVVNVMFPSPPATMLRAVKFASCTSISMCASFVPLVADSTSRSPPPLCSKSITLLMPVTAASSVVSSVVAFWP